MFSLAERKATCWGVRSAPKSRTDKLQEPPRAAQEQPKSGPGARHPKVEESPRAPGSGEGAEKTGTGSSEGAKNSTQIEVMSTQRLGGARPMLCGAPLRLFF